MTASNLTETTVWYQTILKVAGEQSQLVVDGKFGPSTSNALTCFQKIWKLEPSGILDVATNLALNQVAMEWIYRKLIPTPLGQRTDELRDALKRFQSDYGLAADGKVGPATRERDGPRAQDRATLAVAKFSCAPGSGWSSATSRGRELANAGTRRC